MSDQLTKIPGIGASTAAVLASNGIKTVRAVAKMKVGELTLVKGFGEAKAAAVIAAARELTNTGPASAPVAAVSVTNAPVSKKRKGDPDEGSGKKSGKKEKAKKKGQEKGKGKAGKKGKKGKKGKRKDKKKHS